MEGINPLLELIWCVRQAIEAGISTRAALREYFASKAFQSRSQEKFQSQMQDWWLSLDKAQKANLNISFELRLLLDIFEKGLKGEAIYSVLKSFEDEIQVRSLQQLEHRLVRLPFEALIPLLLFIFPALVILGLGPLLDQIRF